MVPYKTKIIKFSKSQKWDFLPELNFIDGTEIECVLAVKMVGAKTLNGSRILIISVERLWILRRMKNMNLDILQLFDVYTKEVTSILEMAVPVWHPGLTRQQAIDIESIQKVAFIIILDNKYSNYNAACDFFNTETLENRRIKLKYARKNLKSDHSFFTKVGINVRTRQKSDIVKEYRCNFRRFEKSSIPYLAKLLNSHNKR